MTTLYKYVDNFYANSLEKLKTLSPENEAIIRKFVEHLEAKGNKVLRVSKLLCETIKLFFISN